MATFVMRDGKLVPATGANQVRIADNGTMRSMAMGCPCVKGQAKRLKMLSARGVDARYHPTTGELIYEGGYRAQKRAAEMAGLGID